MSYYKNELSKLNIKSCSVHTVNFSDNENGSTKTLNINLESISAIREYLDLMEAKLCPSDLEANFDRLRAKIGTLMEMLVNDEVVYFRDSGYSFKLDLNYDGDIGINVDDKYFLVRAETELFNDDDMNDLRDDIVSKIIEILVSL